MRIANAFRKNSHVLISISMGNKKQTGDWFAKLVALVIRNPNIKRVTLFNTSSLYRFHIYLMNLAIWNRDVVQAIEKLEDGESDSQYWKEFEEKYWKRTELLEMIKNKPLGKDKAQAVEELFDAKYWEKAESLAKEKGRQWDEENVEAIGKLRKHYKDFEEKYWDDYIKNETFSTNLIKIEKFYNAGGKYQYKHYVDSLSLLFASKIKQDLSNKADYNHKLFTKIQASYLNEECATLISLISDKAEYHYEIYGGERNRAMKEVYKSSDLLGRMVAMPVLDDDKPDVDNNDNCTSVSNYKSDLDNNSAIALSNKSNLYTNNHIFFNGNNLTSDERNAVFMVNLMRLPLPFYLEIVKLTNSTIEAISDKSENNDQDKTVIMENFRQGFLDFVNKFKMQQMQDCDADKQHGRDEDYENAHSGFGPSQCQ